MKKLLDSLERAGRLAENTALVLLLGTMIGVSVFQIINRELLGSSFALSWADELVKIIVLWLAMVGSIAAARDNRHIRIGVIAWHAYRLIREEISWGDTIFDNTPLWIMHAIVPLAFALISYQFVVRVAKLIRRLVVGDHEEATQ